MILNEKFKNSYDCKGKSMETADKNCFNQTFDSKYNESMISNPFEA